MGKLFGTDGIRGAANAYPMTPEVVLNVGKAVAHVFKKKCGRLWLGYTFYVFPKLLNI